MCDLFGGGNDNMPAPAQLVSPPPREDFPDVIDEMNGVESRTVMENGKKVRVIRALPKTEEEKALYKFAEDMLTSAIKNVKELYQYDPSKVVNYQPFIESVANLNNQRTRELSQITNLGDIQSYIDDFKSMNNQINDQVFAKRYGDLEEGLSHGGQSNSTAANQLRAALTSEESLSRQRGNIEANIYGENIASNRLNRNSQVFNLNEQGRLGHLREAEMGYNLERQKQTDLEERRLQAIRENMNQFQIATGMQGIDMNKKLASHAPELSNQIFQLNSVDALNRTNAENNKRMGQYNIDMAHYNAQPRSFGDIALEAGMTGLGSMLTSSNASVAGRLGSKMFGV